MIRLHKLDLVVTREGVHEAQQLVPNCQIYKEVDLWEEVAVLWTSFVQVGEVHTHPSLPIYLLNYYYISHPFRVVDFSNEACTQQLVNFFNCSLVPFLCEDPLSLSNGWKGWGDVELMDDGIWVNPWHVFVGPGKDVQVVL